MAEPVDLVPFDLGGVLIEVPGVRAMLELTGIQAHSALRTRGRIIADPVDEWGDEQTFRLPWHGIVIQYTSAAVNPDAAPMSIPDIVVKPPRPRRPGRGNSYRRA